MLSYPEYITSGESRSSGSSSSDGGGDVLCLLHVGDAFIRQQMMTQRGWSSSSSSSSSGMSSDSPLTGRRRRRLLYGPVMRMLRLVGVEVLWEDTQDDSEGDVGSKPAGDDEEHPDTNMMCMKDIDGCDCGSEFYQNANLRITLDHLLAEREGFYDLVLNLDSGIRAPLPALTPPDPAHPDDRGRVHSIGDRNRDRDRVKERDSIRDKASDRDRDRDRGKVCGASFAARSGVNAMTGGCEVCMLFMYSLSINACKRYYSFTPS